MAWGGGGPSASAVLAEVWGDLERIIVTGCTFSAPDRSGGPARPRPALPGPVRASERRGGALVARLPRSLLGGDVLEQVAEG